MTEILEPDNISRQEAEGAIRGRMRRSRWAQRFFVGASLAAGIVGGHEALSDDDTSTITLAAMVAACAGGAAEAALARRSCENQIFHYSIAKGGTAGGLARITLQTSESGGLIERNDPDPRAFPYVVSSPRSMGALSPFTAWGGSTWTEVSLQSPYITQVSDRAALVALGGMVTLGSIGFHMLGVHSQQQEEASYVARLDNIDGGLGFGPT
ncbi:MAG: hypothetical protein AAB834_01225 [Patescibacteria group bacterium]